MSVQVQTQNEISKEEIKQMQEIIGEEIIAKAIEEDDNSEIREIITCKNIELGEKRLEEFNGVIRLTKFIPKKGRDLSYEELEEKMPTMFNAIENMEGNPVEIIKKDKAFTADLTLASNEAIAMKRLEASIKIVKQKQGEKAAELVKKAQLEERKSMKAEIKTVEEKGVEWDEQLVFDIWMILRAIRQRKYMEEEKLPVDLLIKLYSYIPRKEYKKIKEYYQSTFNE